MAQKYVGIDLGSQQVKIAVMTAGFRGVQLVDLFDAPVAAPTPAAAAGHEDGDGSDAYLPALQAALVAMRARGLLSETVGVALPASTMSYRLLSFPFAEPRRIAQTIAFEADGQFPYPLEQLAHGHVVVPAPQGGRALMVATKRDRVEQLSTIFKRAGSKLEVVTSGAMAMAQVVDPELGPVTPAMAEQGMSPVSLVLDLGHGSTELVAIGAKGPVAARSIRRAGRHVTSAIARAYSLDAAAAEEAKRRDAFVPHRGQASLSADQLGAGAVIAQAIEPIVREIEHTRMWLRTTHRYEVARIVLTGGAAHLGGLAGYLTEQTGLPCGLGKLKSSLAIRGAEGRDVATFAAALGAAFGAARRPLVQLHDDTVGQNDSTWVQERIGSLAAIGIAVMAFGAIDTIIRVKALDAERDAYAAELEEATKKILGTPVALADVDATLDSSESQDITSLIAQRGALEVLALLAQAATPSDLGKTPILPPGGADPAAEEGPIVEGGEAPVVAPPTAPVVAEPVKNDAGVVVSDEVLFDLIDIRERKIELKVGAARASAQDRLAYRLRDIACLSNIEKSKVRGTDRKQFDMTMDNNCYYASSLGSGDGDGDGDGDSSGPGDGEGGSAGGAAGLGARDPNAGVVTPGRPAEEPVGTDGGGA